MELGRRGFLSLLGLGGAGLVLGKGLPILAAEPLVLPATSTLLTPTWIMKEMALAFKDELGGYRLKYVPCDAGAKVGQEIAGHRMLNQRFVTSEWDYVSAAMGKADDYDTIDRIREFHVRPLAAGLARAVKAQNIHVLSDLSMPMGGARAVRVSSEAYGLALRGAWQYDIGRDREFFRVDLIGGN